MTFDWTPTQPDPARRLFQVRHAKETLPLTREQRAELEELASNLERRFTEKTRPVRGKEGN